MPPINIAPLIEVAGFGLGVLLAAILAFGTQGNRQANRWLATYLFAGPRYCLDAHFTQEGTGAD